MASDRRDWPHFAYRTKRAWKAAARRRVRALEKAVDEARIGCAFYPGGSMPLDQMTEIVQALRARVSVKEWGR